MIVRMSKYDIVLYHGEKQQFLNRLQDLGLVDITVRDWEPNENERGLMTSIDRHKVAVTRLKELAKSEGFKPGKPYENGDEAWAEYLSASSEIDRLDAAIAHAQKEAEDARIWGEFNKNDLAALGQNGIHLRFFQTGSKEFETHKAEWGSLYSIAPINTHGATAYFVVVAQPGEEITINAQEVKAPAASHKEYILEAGRLEKEKEPWNAILARTAASADLIEAHGVAEQERLDFDRVAGTVQHEADGALLLMEGWAPAEVSDDVDKFLDSYPNLFYVKSRPTPEDDTPTMLKNKKPNRMYEVIGSFYSQPKYDTMDLTAWFGPFYALFFGLCLADAGYGLIYFILGLVLISKSKAKPGMRSLANLVTLLGFSTMVCGTLMDSFFGMKLTGWAPLAGLQNYLIGDYMFNISLGIGVVQILLAMALKVYMYTKKYGFRYALSTIGWMLVIITVLVPVLADMLNINLPEFASQWSLPRIILAGVGLFMMLFLNSPGKNPLVNFGSGLWNTYNDIVGFISDFLSYIRLFAIGLSGGILAMVFNMLAVGMSGSIPVLKQVIMIIILLIGHGLTLFMSTISAFVHPMRLTFVEFYKNAGFEDTQRLFTPFKRNNSK